jgi:sulfotransferase
VPLRIHFISGLPRSGSTLVAGILRQNPRFQARVSSPLADILASAMRSMSGANDASIFISEGQRKRVLRSIVEAYYADHEDHLLVFDTNRAWSALLPALAELFPASRVICCLRSPAWILDSVERCTQRNAFEPPRIFNHEPLWNVYTRVEALTKNSFVGAAINNLRQAWFGEFADRLIAIRYDSLTECPSKTISQLYELLGEERFNHNFDHVEYDEPHFDAYLGMPGFHRVSGPVKATTRKTILPPELFSQFDRPFWDMAGQNPRGVKLL